MSYSPFPPVDGTPASAAPTEALQVGGTDGTNLRALRTDQNGQEYVVPAAPGTATADRPAVELSVGIAAAVTVTTTVVAAPGAGKHFRVFAAKMSGGSSGTTVSVECTVNGKTMTLSQLIGVAGSDQFVAPLTGIKTDDNTALKVTFYAGTGGTNAFFLYTTETD